MCCRIFFVYVCYLESKQKISEVTATYVVKIDDLNYEIAHVMVFFWFLDLLSPKQSTRILKETIKMYRIIIIISSVYQQSVTFYPVPAAESIQ